VKVYEKKDKDSKKSCFSSTMDVLPGGNKKPQYNEEKIDLVGKTIQQLKVLSGNSNEVYCSLCKRFRQQSAQKSDKKRQKRRQKEQRKNVRKKSLEKNTTNSLSLILKSTPRPHTVVHIIY